MQFAVFEKFTSAYWHHIAQEIILLLVNNTHEKTSQIVKTNMNLTAHAICNLHLCYNFALMLHENALVFSQSIRHA